MTATFNTDPLVTAAEICATLKVSRATLGRMVRQGTITPVNCGLSVLRFRQSDIRALVDGQAPIKARLRSKGPGKGPGRPKLYLSADEALAD